MGILDTLLESLDDGEWHNVNELSTKEGLRKVSITRLMLSLTFFVDHDFVECGESWRGDPPRPVMDVKLAPPMQTFVRRLKWIERSEKHGQRQP